MRMIEIENNINMEFIRSNEYKIDKDKIIWDPYYDVIVDNNAITKIKSSGGILSDTMGLGKTITTIGLMHYGKTIEKKDIVSVKTYSKATLVIPSKLAYGPENYGYVPPYSALIVEVELIAAE
jgi:SNF2 family DNA or RNA helicase